MSSTARAFRDFAKKAFLVSSVEPAIEIFHNFMFFLIGEFVARLVEASPVDVVVIVFGLVFVSV